MSTIRFHHIGRWSAEQISVQWNDSTRRDDSAAQELIESSWKRAKEKLGDKLFNGEMCRLESMSERGDSLSLDVSRTDYKTFLGTNLSNASLPDEVRANPIGISVGLKSSDGYFLLGQRNAAVAYYPNRLHPFAGTLEPLDVPDVFAAAMRELHEELDLSIQHLSQTHCVGVAEDVSLRQPEMIFFALSTLTCEQLSQRTRDEEHDSAWSVRVTQVDVAEKLASDEPFTPIARATLLLCGRIEFGHAWFIANRSTR